MSEPMARGARISGAIQGSWPRDTVPVRRAVRAGIPAPTNAARAGRASRYLTTVRSTLWEQRRCQRLAPSEHDRASRAGPGVDPTGGAYGVLANVVVPRSVAPRADRGRVEVRPRVATVRRRTARSVPIALRASPARELDARHPQRRATPPARRFVAH